MSCDFCRMTPCACGYGADDAPSAPAHAVTDYDTLMPWASRPTRREHEYRTEDDFVAPQTFGPKEFRITARDRQGRVSVYIHRLRQTLTLRFTDDAGVPVDCVAYDPVQLERHVNYHVEKLLRERVPDHFNCRSAVGGL